MGKEKLDNPHYEELDGNYFAEYEEGLHYVKVVTHSGPLSLETLDALRCRNLELTSENRLPERGFPRATDRWRYIFKRGFRARV